MLHIFKSALFLRGKRNKSKSLLRISPSEPCTQHSLRSAADLTGPGLIYAFGCRDRGLQSSSCSSGIPVTFTIPQNSTPQNSSRTAGGAGCHKLATRGDSHLRLVDLPGSSNPFVFNLIITAENSSCK